MDTAEAYCLRAHPTDRTSQLNSKHQMTPTASYKKIMYIMVTEQRLEQTEKIEHIRRLPHAIKQMLTGRKDVSSFTTFWVAEHRPVRPHERPLEPLTETDGDETGDDDAGETSAVKSKLQPMKPTDQEIDTHEACGHHPYRDWCRACVGVGAVRRSQTTAWRTKQYHTWEATPFLAVKVKPSMMI